MLIALYAVVILSLILFLVAGIRLFRSSRAVEDSLGVIEAATDIDPSRYRPMERLLRNEDCLFLAESGVDTRGIRKWRAERRMIFRKYLWSLSSDFGVITREVRRATLESSQPRPDLISALARARMTFMYTLFLMEIQLCLHATGWNGLAFDTRPMVAMLENMREQWNMVGSPALSAA